MFKTLIKRFCKKLSENTKKVLWCCACVARWWAARAAGGAGGAGGGAAAAWLAARGSCPVCRAVFCLLDVRPARRRPS